MRLSELSPKWLGSDGRKGIGVSFLCPHCKKQRLPIAFANPLDGGDPDPSFERHWRRTGDTFETLTLFPSVDASSFGHWHGEIHDGDAR